MNPVLPEEFIDMINDGDSGSRQRCEDRAFGRLYRGYKCVRGCVNYFVEPKNNNTNSYLADRCINILFRKSRYIVHTLALLGYRASLNVNVCQLSEPKL